MTQNWDGEPENLIELCEPLLHWVRVAADLLAVRDHQQFSGLLHKHANEVEDFITNYMSKEDGPVLAKVTKIGIINKRGALSASMEMPWCDDYAKVPTLLCVPDTAEPDHHHMQLTWEGAATLHRWLGEQIASPEHSVAVDKALSTLAQKVDAGEISVRFLARFLDLTVEDIAELVRPYGVEVGL